MKRPYPQFAVLLMCVAANCGGPRSPASTTGDERPPEGKQPPEVSERKDAGRDDKAIADGGVPSDAAASAADAAVSVSIPPPSSDLPPFTSRLGAPDFTGSLTVALVGGVAPPPVTQDRAGLFLFYDGRGDPSDGDTMLLHLRASNGVFEAAVSGFAKRYNLRFHRGTLEGAKVTPGGLTGRIKLRLEGDAFAPEGEASYDLQLTQKDGALEGSFSGSFAGAAVSGKVQGHVRHRWPLLRTAKPLARNEHPRMLFRREDLPVLRQRAMTPQGQQLIARMKKLHELDKDLVFKWNGSYETNGPPYAEGSWAVSHCFLYALTGDKAEAERGRLIADYTMGRTDGEWLRWGVSLRRHYAALAYDLCYDGWDPTFRKRATDFLAADAWRGRTPDATVDLIFAIADGQSALAMLGDDEDVGGKAAARLADVEGLLHWHFTTAVGDRGFTAETNNYTDVVYSLLPFAHAMRTALGRDLAAGTGLGWIVPLAIATDVGTLRNDWGAESWFRVMGFPGQIPDAYRPVMRWLMDQHPNLGVSLPSHAVYAFLTYPFDTPAKSPKEAKLPLVLEDKRLGALVARSGWDAGDLYTTFQLRSGATRSSMTAGDFVIGGGGQEEQLAGLRPAAGGYYVLPRLPAFVPNEMGVVQMVDGSFNPGGPRVAGALPVGGGRATHVRVGRDGSAIVSALYDRWVHGESWRDNNHPTAGQHAYRNQYAKSPVDLGVRVLQSFAVDYSKASGAPALYALAYKAQGAPDRGKAAHLSFGRWQHAYAVAEGNRFRVHGVREREPDPKNVMFDGIVLAPTPPKLTVWRAYGNPNLLQVEGASEYLIVMTLLPPASAAGPALQPSGTGSGGKVTVGGQEVSFDGEKLVLKVAPTP